VLAHWNFYYWSTLLEDPKSNIANEVIGYENGQLLCTFNFKANAQIHVPDPADDDVSFNLNEEAFYLFLAKGPLTENKIQIHEVKDISPEPVYLTEQEIVSKMNIQKFKYSIYDGCGNTKGCFGIPSNCIEEKNCQVAFSHKRLSNNMFEFQLISDQIQSDEYIAVGLSQDKFMRNDAVIACTTAYR
jgi:hypothetical protein